MEEDLRQRTLHREHISGRYQHQRTRLALECKSNLQMWGFRGSGPPLREPKNTKPFLHSLICPRYLYNGNHYPIYLSGAGYYKCLLENLLSLDLFCCMYLVTCCPVPLGPASSWSPSVCPTSTSRTSSSAASPQLDADSPGGTLTASTADYFR